MVQNGRVPLCVLGHVFQDLASPVVPAHVVVRVGVPDASQRQKQQRHGDSAHSHLFGNPLEPLEDALHLRVQKRESDGHRDAEHQVGRDEVQLDVRDVVLDGVDQPKYRKPRNTATTRSRR